MLPKSVTESRIRENLRLVELDEGDLERLLKVSEDGETKRYTKGAWPMKFGFEDGF